MLKDVYLTHSRVFGKHSTTQLLTIDQSVEHVSEGIQLKNIRTLIQTISITLNNSYKVCKTSTHFLLVQCIPCGTSDQSHNVAFSNRKSSKKSRGHFNQHALIITAVVQSNCPLAPSKTSKQWKEFLVEMVLRDSGGGSTLLEVELTD